MFLTRTRIFLISLLSIGFATTSQASFHTWDISELFSSADGTQQYIEFQEVNGSNNQHQLLNRDLISSSGGMENILTFGNNLPNSSTANRNFLVATAAFVAATGLQADYIISDGFLFLSNGTLNFANVDTISYGALPTDGFTALFANGSTGAGTPTNYSGDSVTLSNVPLPAAAWLYFSGLSLLAIARRRRVL